VQYTNLVTNDERRVISIWVRKLINYRKSGIIKTGHKWVHVDELLVVRHSSLFHTHSCPPNPVHSIFSLMVSESDKQKIQSKIREELVELHRNIKQLELVTQPIKPDNAIGRLTRMDAINNKAVNDAALLKAQERKGQLEDVLGGIHLPDFGNCLRCKKPIQFKRLLYMPESKVCVNCANR